MRRAIVLGCALLLVACAGAKARDASLPQLRLVWVQVKQDAFRYSQELPQAGGDELREVIREGDQVLRNGSRAQIVVQPWEGILGAADASVQVMLDAEEIGPQGAILARENHKQFRDLLARYRGTN